MNNQMTEYLEVAYAADKDRGICKPFNHKFTLEEASQISSMEWVRQQQYNPNSLLQPELCKNCGYYHLIKKYANV